MAPFCEAQSGTRTPDPFLTMVRGTANGRALANTSVTKYLVVGRNGIECRDGRNTSWRSECTRLVPLGRSQTAVRRPVVFAGPLRWISRLGSGIGCRCLLHIRLKRRSLLAWTVSRVAVRARAGSSFGTPVFAAHRIDGVGCARGRWLSESPFAHRHGCACSGPCRLRRRQDKDGHFRSHS